MSNVFEGPPDGRQSADVRASTSRFRPVYRAMSEAEFALHNQIKETAFLLEGQFAEIEALRAKLGMAPQPRYHALALTHLEAAIMWAVKGLTA